jgi:hypothetical protein
MKENMDAIDSAIGYMDAYGSRMHSETAEKAKEQYKQMKESAQKTLTDLKNAEMNFDRLLKHLEKIAEHLDIEYMDGDFPINEVLQKYDDLLESNRDWEQSFDMYDACMRRALKAWQKEHPGCDYWPDGAANIAWFVDFVQRNMEKE